MSGWDICSLLCGCIYQNATELYASQGKLQVHAGYILLVWMVKVDPRVETAASEQFKRRNIRYDATKEFSCTLFGSLDFQMTRCTAHNRS